MLILNVIFLYYNAGNTGKIGEPGYCDSYDGFISDDKVCPDNDRNKGRNHYDHEDDEDGDDNEDDYDGVEDDDYDDMCYQRK